MRFEQGHLFHIYNQGNNRQLIFFNNENYRYFKGKIIIHILPFADILAWCLMPNHFHLLVHVNAIEVNERLVARAQSGCDFESPPDSCSRRMSFNKSIGIMLASYTRAINKQKGWSGSLFRKETKAICLTQPNGISPAWFTDFGVTRINSINHLKEYPNVCFNYILNNPVKAGLVKRPEEWEYSSCREITGNNNNILINITRIKEYGLEINQRYD